MPNKLEIRMPRVIKSWVEDPKGPLSSVGVISLMKLGTKTEKAPPVRPKINLPAATTSFFYTRVRPHPIMSNMLVKRMQFFFPKRVKGAEPREPTARPTEHALVIIVDHRSLS